MNIDTKILEKAVIAIAEAFAELGQLINNSVKSLKLLANEILDCLEETKKTKQVRSSWNVPLNITRQSQVMDRKPRFIVRKVIT